MTSPRARRLEAPKASWGHVAVAALVVAGACTKAPAPELPPQAPAAAPPAAPAPAPAPATPTQAQAIPAPAGVAAAVTPVAAAAVPAAAPPTSVPLSRFWAPIFVQGNRWTYKIHGTTTDEGVERKTDGVKTCSVQSVTTLDAATVAKVTCQDNASKGAVPIDAYYVATQRGLWQSWAMPSAASLPGLFAQPPLLLNPPRPWSHEDKSEGDGWLSNTSAMVFERLAVAGRGTVEAYCNKTTSFQGGGDASKTCFAADVGYVLHADEGGEESWTTNSEKLIDSQVAPPVADPPLGPVPGEYAGKPSVVSVAMAAEAAGLQCMSALPALFAAGLSASPSLLGDRALRLPSGWGESRSDVRPEHLVYRGKVPATKCKLTIELRNGLVQRIGSDFKSKPIANEALAVLGTPTSHRDLAQGGALDSFAFGDAVLVVYRPGVAAPDNEWWLYDPRQWAAIKETDGQIWTAFGFNDVAMALEAQKPMDPVAVAGFYQKAVEAFAPYPRAHLRLCKVLAKAKLDPARARKECSEAIKSVVDDVRTQAANLLEKLP